MSIRTFFNFDINKYLTVIAPIGNQINQELACKLSDDLKRKKIKEADTYRADLMILYNTNNQIQFGVINTVNRDDLTVSVLGCGKNHVYFDSIDFIMTEKMTCEISPFLFSLIESNRTAVKFADELDLNNQHHLIINRRKIDFFFNFAQFIISNIIQTLTGKEISIKLNRADVISFREKGAYQIQYQKLNLHESDFLKSIFYPEQLFGTISSVPKENEYGFTDLLKYYFTFISSQIVFTNEYRKKNTPGNQLFENVFLFILQKHFTDISNYFGSGSVLGEILSHNELEELKRRFTVIRKPNQQIKY